MTRPLSKEELTRGFWLTELRRQGHRQCRGSRDGSKVCALMLLADITHMKQTSKFGPLWWNEIAARVGLTETQCGKVLGMNDTMDYYVSNDGTLRVKGHVYTFADIANTIEGWFK